MNLKWKIVFAFALALVIQDCSSAEKPAGAHKAKAQPAKLVKVMALQQRTLLEKLELPGTLQAENTANILSTAEGKISQLMVREGDRVKKDQVVARISSLLREDIINSARLLVQSKQEALQKNPGNAALKQELKQAEDDFRFAQKQYKEIAVTAPMSGVISNRWVDTGDMISAKSRLFEIQSDNKLVIHIPVSEIDLRKLSRGQSAKILADACPKKVFEGRISRIYPQIDAGTRNGMVELALLNPCKNLKEGMFVRATFIIRTLTNVDAIPQTAIIDRPQQKTCFVVVDGKAQEKVVQTGLEENGWVQILTGLNKSDRVVIEGQQQLKTGVKVKIQGAKKAQKPEGGGK